MSAPETNVEKQGKRHKGSLLGIGAVVVFALVLFAAMMGYLADEGGTPEGAETQIDSRTGAEVETDG